MFNKWINEPKSFEKDNETFIIQADNKTDFFVDPTSDYVAKNAPIYAFDIKGDFTFECKVKPGFTSVYDAGAIVFYIDNETWIKLAFEKTDLGHTAVVSVVTDGVSDDANGEKVEESSIWLKLSKKGDVFGLHFSYDSIKWRMVRLFKYDTKNSEKAYLGVAAQSPAGEGCSVEFSHIKYSDTAAKELRKGI